MWLVLVTVSLRAVPNSIIEPGSKAIVRLYRRARVRVAMYIDMCIRMCTDMFDRACLPGHRFERAVACTHAHTNARTHARTHARSGVYACMHDPSGTEWRRHGWPYRHGACFR